MPSQKKKNTNSYKIYPLMPKGVAVWLVENTTLTFKQIADFCGLHHLEIQGIADGDLAKNISAVNPIYTSQLTIEEIKRCESDKNATLNIIEDIYAIKDQTKKQKYIPKSLKKERRNAAAWLIIKYPDLPDIKIAKFIGLMKKTVIEIRQNHKNILPKDPVLLGLCSQNEFYTLVNNYIQPNIDK